MKKYLSVVLMSGLLATAVVEARPGGPLHDGPPKHVLQALDSAQLSTAQREQVRLAFEGHRETLDGLHEREREARDALALLDAKQDSYEASVAKTAETLAGFHRTRIVQEGRLQSELAAVMNPEQWAMFQQNSQPPHLRYGSFLPAPR